MPRRKQCEGSQHIFAPGAKLWKFFQVMNESSNGKSQEAIGINVWNWYEWLYTSGNAGGRLIIYGSFWPDDPMLDYSPNGWDLGMVDSWNNSFWGFNYP